MHSDLNTCIYDSSVVYYMSVHFHTYMVLDVTVQHNIHTNTLRADFNTRTSRLYACTFLRIFHLQSFFRPHTYINVWIYTHTSIQTSIHASIPSYLTTYIPTYLLTSLHQYIISSMHTYLHTSIHTYIHTYILHTYMHTYIH